MIEIQIISILSLFWKHNTFLAVYCTLFIRYIFKNKQKQKKAKQISKQNKTKQKRKKKDEGKKKVHSIVWTRYLRVDPNSHGHYATEDEHMKGWKVSNIMPFPWNFRRQTIEPYWADWKKDSKQSDEIKANWNQATDCKKQCKRISWQWNNICDTKPTQLLHEVGRKT